MSSAKPLISVISPCYNEELSVTECYLAVKRVFDEMLPTYDWELIFSDNHSKDNTVEVLRGLAKKDSRVKVIVNARNYEPSRSSFNALMQSKGDAALTMLAVDLQDPPELLKDFVTKWKEGYKVIYGVRKNRKEGILMRTARAVFYRLVAMSSNVEIPINAGDFQFVDRQVIEALRGFKDHHPYIRGMIANVGFKSIGIPYDWGIRKHGKSRHNFLRLYDQAVNGLISFTNLPMRISVFVGSFLAFGSIVYGFVNLLIAVFSQHAPASAGIETLIVALFFFSGTQLLFVGVIGEYVAAIHAQVRQGAVLVEQERINFEN